MCVPYATCIGSGDGHLYVRSIRESNDVILFKIVFICNILSSRYKVASTNNADISFEKRFNIQTLGIYKKKSFNDIVSSPFLRLSIWRYEHELTNFRCFSAYFIANV